MTLEGFFTPTEMKDGLTAPNRVEELLSVMQKDKDSDVKSADEATRQWSTVAKIIAATVNRDCLELFIQLDGLVFINRWLNDTQKLHDDTGESPLEESIFSLLQAVDRLHVNNERLVASGIWTTVQNLISHHSSRIQDRVRELFDGWKQPVDCVEVCEVAEEVPAVSRDCGTVISSMHDHGKEHSEHSAMESKENACIGDFTEASRVELSESRRADHPELAMMKDLVNDASTDQMNYSVATKCPDAEDGTSENMDFTMSCPVEGSLTMSEKSGEHPKEETVLVEKCSSPDLVEAKRDGMVGRPVSEDFSDDETQIERANISAAQLGQVEGPSAASSLESGGGPLGADAAKAEPSSQQISLQNDGDTKDGESSLKSLPLNDKKSFAPEGRSDLAASWGLSHSRRGRLEDQEKSPSMKVKDKDHASDRDRILPSVSHLPKPRRSATVKKTFDYDFEYGTVDALEVARRVARAVEREVVDDHEPFCSSSSEKISAGLIGEPSSPDSINADDSHSSDSRANDVPIEQNVSSQPSPAGETQFTTAENVMIMSENGIPDLESSQVTEAAGDAEVSAEKDGMCGFDLNEEVCSEDANHTPVPNTELISDNMDCPINNTHSIPVAVVSASRALATPGLPGTPLQFEGALGWKGSAATSAFRPASPRRGCDGDKTTTFGSTSSSPKQKRDILNFDLNVAEDMDDKNGDLSSGKEIPLSSSIPSGESCVELGPKRPERMELDLNSIGDAGEAPQSDWRMDGRVFNHLVAHRSPSPASSSSSMQPRMKNIDLNEGPLVHHSSTDEQGYFGKSPQYVNAYVTPKPMNSVISIMGTRVEVGRKNLFPQRNGKLEELTIDANVARAGSSLMSGTAVPYAHSLPYGYNGITMGSAMSLSSTMYGPGSSIAYMVDSRGAPVIPQVLGSASPVPPSYAQAPFIMNMTGGPSGLSWAAPSRPNSDVNAGFTNGALHRHDLASRQIFIPGQGTRLMEEHFRVDSQPSSSSEKRKEPEGGWDLYSHNLKHHQPPWK